MRKKAGPSLRTQVIQVISALIAVLLWLGLILGAEVVLGDSLGDYEAPEWIIGFSVICLICGGIFLWKVVFYQIDIRWGQNDNSDKQGNPEENIMNE